MPSMRAPCAQINSMQAQNERMAAHCDSLERDKAFLLAQAHALPFLASPTVACLRSARAHLCDSLWHYGVSSACQTICGISRPLQCCMEADIAQ